MLSNGNLSHLGIRHMKSRYDHFSFFKSILTWIRMKKMCNILYHQKTSSQGNCLFLSDWKEKYISSTARLSLWNWIISCKNALNVRFKGNDAENEFLAYLSRKAVIINAFLCLLIVSRCYYTPTKYAPRALAYEVVSATNVWGYLLGQDLCYTLKSSLILKEIIYLINILCILWIIWKHMLRISRVEWWDNVPKYALGCTGIEMEFGFLKKKFHSFG